MSLWGDYLKDLLDVSFNGASLQEIAGAQVVDHNFDEMPEIRSSRNPVSSAHRSITSGRYFITKRASVSLAVHGDDLHELQAILARIRQLTQYRNKNVVLTFGVPIKSGSSYDLTQTRTVTFKNANLVAADFGHNATHGTVITVEFTIDEPVGVGGTPQTLYSQTGLTGSSNNIDLSALTIQGTFEEQYPIYKFTINSVTNGSNPSFKIVLGLIEMTISQALAAGDVLFVDTDEMKVTLNGELIDFSGGLPFIADPTATISITNTFSAINRDLEIKINPRYI